MSEIFLTGSKKKTNRQKKNNNKKQQQQQQQQKQDKKQLQQELYSTKFKEMYPKFTRSSHVEIHILIENKIKKTVSKPHSGYLPPPTFRSKVKVIQS